MEKILVIDFGSQYTQLIARRLRELSVYSEVCPWDEIPDLSAVKGFILSGGPESSNIEGNPSIHQQIFDSKKTYFRHMLWHASFSASRRRQNY